MTSPQIPPARNLQADGADAEARRLPVLLYFSQTHCSFCRRMEEEVLLPMLRSGRYEDRILLREVAIDLERSLTGFDGGTLDSRMLFHLYDGVVTPTLQFTDGRGRPLGEPLVGINTVELFGWYLDNAIDHALQQLRTSRP